MRCRRVEIWSSGSVHASRDVEEAQRYGALEMRCRRVDVEVWRAGTSSVLLLLLEFLAFVPQGLRLASPVEAQKTGLSGSAKV